MKSRSVELDKPPTFAPMRWSLVLLCIPLLLGLSGVECARSKPIDYEALEKAWEAGDEAQELRTEGDEHYRQLAYKSEDEAKALGPQMIFVTLKNEGTVESLPGIASRWKEMLWNGGVEVSIYEVADSKLLVGLQKGIFVLDTMQFLDEQPNVKEYEWNGEAYSPDRAATSHAHHQKKPRKPRRGIKAGKDTKPNKKSHRKRAAQAKTGEKRQSHSSNDEL